MPHARLTTTAKLEPRAILPIRTIPAGLRRNRTPIHTLNIDKTPQLESIDQKLKKAAGEKGEEKSATTTTAVPLTPSLPV